MRRLAALLGKEARHHGLFVLALVLVIGPLAAIGLLGTASSPEVLTLFEWQRIFLMVFAPLIGLVVGNRLIVAEYQNRTQLFLEGLPMRRGEMVVLKFVLGLVLMLGATLLSLLTTALFASFREPVDAPYLFAMGVRTVAWTFALWGFLFAMGFTGRFRLAIYTSLLFLVFALDSLTGVELGRFGLFAVIDATLPLERSEVPWADVAVAIAVGAGCTVGGLGLALVNEGSLAESLARRMSAREKGAVGAILLLGLIAISAAEEKTDAPPFELPDDGSILTRGSIQIAYGDAERLALARELMDELTPPLSELPQTLGWDELPTVRLAHSAALDAQTFETVSLAPDDGVLVRAALDETNLDRAGLRTELIRQTLIAHTRGRADFEPRAMLLDGLSRHWADANTEETRRRAAYAVALTPVSEVRVVEWYRTREELGPPIADALAASGVRALIELAGQEAVVNIAKELFGKPPHDDVRSAAERWTLALDALIESHTDHTIDAWLDHWNDSLGDVTTPAPLIGELQIETIEGELRRIVGTATGPPPAERAILTLVHHPLEPLEHLIEELELERTETTWPASHPQQQVRLDGRYGPGEKAFVALERVDAELGCAVRFAATRITIE